jgi:hypothetical protein
MVGQAASKRDQHPEFHSRFRFIGIPHHFLARGPRETNETPPIFLVKQVLVYDF